MQDWQILTVALVCIFSASFLIFKYLKRKKIKENLRSAESLERMQIREYGRKINEETRSKNQK
tara:strand:- start:91 stop:279 length:189 start_codon:yes stop_codon:yes gene_type:complete